MQDVPSGVPSTLQPSNLKIDVPRLQEDAPKYKRWLTETAAHWWDQLDIRSIYHDEKQSSEWIHNLEEGNYVIDSTWA